MCERRHDDGRITQILRADADHHADAGGTGRGNAGGGILEDDAARGVDADCRSAGKIRLWMRLAVRDIIRGHDDGRLQSRGSEPHARELWRRRRHDRPLRGRQRLRQRDSAGQRRRLVRHLDLVPLEHGAGLGDNLGRHKLRDEVAGGHAVLGAGGEVEARGVLGGPAVPADRREIQ